MMKAVVNMFFILAATVASGQDIGEKKKIDSLVSYIEKASDKKITLRGRGLDWIEYWVLNNKTTKIIHHLKAGPKEIVRTYFTNNNSLIYSIEQLMSYYLYGDSVRCSGNYYFKDWKLIDHLTLGHGKSGLDDWNPEIEVLESYNKTLSYMERNNKKQQLNKQ